MAVTPVGTERRWTELLQVGLAPITGEAGGAGAGEAGGQLRSGAGGPCGCGEQGLAAAAILAELAIPAGVRQLASLTQKSRDTPGGTGTFQASDPSFFSPSSSSSSPASMKTLTGRSPAPETASSTCLRWRRVLGQLHTEALGERWEDEMERPSPFLLQALLRAGGPPCGSGVWCCVPPSPSHSSPSLHMVPSSQPLHSGLQLLLPPPSCLFSQVQHSSIPRKQDNSF